jgi:uncharacterized membrane protein YgcG
MSMTLEQALATALDDEYKARATYRAVLDAYGEVRPFSRIVESEERHIEALHRLYDRYELTPPSDTWPDRVSLPPSLADACQAGIDGERENAALYAKLIAAVEDFPDVAQTFRRLHAASQENHLPAFERGLRREQGQGRSAGRGEGRGGGRGASAGGRGRGGGGHGRRGRHRGGRGGGAPCAD